MSDQEHICTRCSSKNLKTDVPLNKLGVNYLSGLIVKHKPLQSIICLDCGKVDLQIEQAGELKDKELVQGTNGKFLPFIIFALFILSLQLD